MEAARERSTAWQESPKRLDLEEKWFPKGTLRLALTAIAKNIAMGIPPIRNMRVRQGRTITREPSDYSLTRYALDLLSKIEDASGSLENKSVLEIGPGDNLVSGLALVAAGASHYTVLDRFRGTYGSDEAVKWYHALAERWGGLRGSAWPSSIDPKHFAASDRVSVVEGAVENAELPETYDVVCSNAVGEHVSDIRAFAMLTKQALSPDGIGLHIIDFRGHEWDNERDPFLFLRFPDWVWRAMGSNRGMPNRVRFTEYKEAFEEAGLSVSIIWRAAFECDLPAENDDFRTAQAAFVVKHASG